MGAGFKEEDSRHIEVLICLFPRSRAWHSLFLACLQGVPGEMPPIGSTLVISLHLQRGRTDWAAHHC